MELPIIGTLEAPKPKNELKRLLLLIMTLLREVFKGEFSKINVKL